MVAIVKSRGERCLLQGLGWWIGAQEFVHRVLKILGRGLGLTAWLGLLVPWFSLTLAQGKAPQCFEAAHQIFPATRVRMIATAKARSMGKVRTARTCLFVAPCT